MVFNSSVVGMVSNLSASLCQYIACNPQRYSGDQVLHILFCYPCQCLRPLALSLWTCLCFSPPDPSSSDAETDITDHHSD